MRIVNHQGEHCFWILTDGTIVKPEVRHILAVVAAPIPFGETPASIQATFAEHGQPVESNYEGKAREEVLARVIARNHVRIRKNQYRKCQHWSVQLQVLTAERRTAIAAWARYVMENAQDKHAEVIIHELGYSRRTSTTLNRLAEEAKEAEQPAIITQGELACQK